MRILIRVGVYVVLVAALYFLGTHFGDAYQRLGTETKSGSWTIVFLGGYLALGGLLAGLAAWDIGRLLGGWAEDAVLGDSRPLTEDPRLSEAARRLEAGDPLDAVRAIREYLAEKPRDWQMQVRIAEIYTHDLRNPLAAALEYEQILQRRHSRRARAWLMVRLADCYLLQRRGDEAIALFDRVTRQFHGTPAAQRAARRLARAGLGEAPEAAEAEPEADAESAEDSA